MSDYHLQLCADGMDITGQVYAEDDATEVRVWDEDAVVIAVSDQGDGRWAYEGSDYGRRDEWDPGSLFDTWRAALDAFGFEAVTE